MYNIFLLKKEKKLIGEKVLLRKPKIDNWKEWAELRQRSRNFLQPWEPKWPDNFLTRESFTSFVNISNISLKKKDNYNYFTNVFKYPYSDHLTNIKPVQFSKSIGVRRPLSGGELFSLLLLLISICLSLALGVFIAFSRGGNLDFTPSWLM